jgi:hypothetical protein
MSPSPSYEEHPEARRGEQRYEDRRPGEWRSEGRGERYEDREYAGRRPEDGRGERRYEERRPERRYEERRPERRYDERRPEVRRGDQRYGDQRYEDQRYEDQEYDGDGHDGTDGDRRYADQPGALELPGRRGPGGRRTDEPEQYRGSAVGPLVRERKPPYRRESGQIAAVLLYQNGGHSVVWPDRRDDHDKPVLRQAYTVFEVLLGQNVTTFELALPAAGDAQFFDARVEVRWEVEDPHTVAVKRVWDVREQLRGELLHELRQVSRRFRLTDAQRADEAVQDELAGGRIDLGRDLGLRIRFHVFIDLSDVVRRRKSERDDIDFDMTRNEAQAEADRRREALERRLVAERAAELEAVLRRGQEAEIIHVMARNPDKEWEIRQAIREEKREGQTDLIKLFNRLLDTGHLERHDIGDQMFETLRLLRESGGAVLGGVTDQLLLGQQPRRELEGPPRTRDRRPADDRDDWSADRGDIYRDDRAEPERPPWDDEPRVYRPTRVESAAERDRNDRDERMRDGGGWDDRDRDDRDRDGHDRGRHNGAGRGTTRRGQRPSADFDDWGEE